MKRNIILIILIIFLDQLIKFFISNMEVFSSITIISNFLSITYVQNTGAAFSILSDNTLLIIIISFLFLYLLYKYILNSEKYKNYSFLLIGGVISNLIDRIFRGYVIDYLDFKIINYNFPIFNVADICIVIGCIIVIIYTLKKE